MISGEIARIESLERELSLKQLQIKSLLTITQAINEHQTTEQLLTIYKSFLSWEMGINKMVLFIFDKQWEMMCEIDTDPLIFYNRIDKIFASYNALHLIQPTDPIEFHDYDVLIPVIQDYRAIAYVLIEGLKEQDDFYNRLQFITTITNMIVMAIENKRLVRQQIQQEGYKKEIELAEEVQKMLIPEQLPNNTKYELAKFYRPHFNIGGDYLDYICIDSERFMFCIADISGKGVAAALLMANFQAVIQSLAFRNLSMPAFVELLNETVYRITKSDKYITFFVAEVNLKEKKLDYVNAGHQPPFYYSDGQVQRLDKGTTVIGAFDELPFIEDGSINIKEGDLIFTFTDGLIDLVDQDGQYFEDQRIEDFVQRRGTLDATDFNIELIEEIEAFRGVQQYTDDIALLTCKIK